MNGLLKKEVLVLKSGWKGYALIAVIFAAVSFMGNPTYLSSMMVLFSMILPMSSFSADEVARWDTFAAALPGGRQAVVKAKYQCLLVILGLAAGLNVLVDLLLYICGRAGGYSLWELLGIALVSVAVGLLVNSIFYPLMFKYGAQKGRIALAVVVGIVTAAAVMGMMLFSFGDSTVMDLLEAVPMLPPIVTVALVAAALVLALILSYRISQHIYGKKEF